MGIRLTLLDRAALFRDGVEVPLEQRFMDVLIRLAMDLGRNVAVDDLSREVLLAADGSPAALPSEPGAKDELRRRRIHVYKCVSALRVALDPDRPGDSSELLVRDPGRNPGYRLEIPPDDVDLLRFERLASAPEGDPPLRTIVRLQQALDVWRDRPLVDVAHFAWAKPRIAAIHEAKDEARIRLLDLYTAFQRPAQALEVGRALLIDRPHDTALRARLADFARQTRHAPGISHLTGWSDGQITVRIGNLFEQHDAHLVVGFSDTFETNTRNDVLVARSSIQGQLLHQLYGGDHRLLDRELRRALRDRPHVVETRATKRYGKLRRYPVGTVAVVHQGSRRIFMVAYSRVNEHGVYAQSSIPVLRQALDRLWAAIREKGQHRPVSIAVVGSGLARIKDTDRIGLIRLIADTFLTAQPDGRVTDELRIIIHPTDANSVDMTAVDTALSASITNFLPM